MKFHRQIAKSLAALPTDARLAVAVSGGVDSVVLLHALVSYCKKFAPQRKIFVLHLNHNTRGKESRAEQEFVKELCQKLRVSLVTETLAKLEKPTQTTLRMKRKQFFAKHLLPTDFLFLAHHLDDQAETMLLRLIRGVGVRGLRGMPALDSPIVRPFLSISKEEILQEAKAHKISWREDSSNATTKYERNWIRLELLPLLESRRPGVKKRLAALAEEVAQLAPTPLPRPLWRSKKGWRLYRLEGNGWSDTAVLSRLFGFDRALARRLQERIQAGEGKLEYRTCIYWVSCGFLLVGAERRKGAKLSAQEFRSEFGRWFPRAPFFTRQQLAGDSTKKLFQEKKIPVFFRDAFPLIKDQGKTQLVLHSDRPSTLAKKFFSAIPLRDVRAHAAAKERFPTQ